MRYIASSLFSFLLFESIVVGIILTPGTSSASSMGPNETTTLNLLNSEDGNCPPDNQTVVTTVLTTLTGLNQINALVELGPIFKVVQFSLEKLTFLLHKELEETLYTKRQGYNLFAIAGYDNLKQHSVHTYTGYKVNSFYQLVGLTYGYEKLKLMGGLGASESYISNFTPPRAAHGSYPTVYGTFGVSGMRTRWHYGIEALYGYSFLHTEHTLSFLNQRARSNHGAWNASAEAHVAYEIQDDFFTFRPYENLGYIYGQENNYQETGAPGANFKVKSETLSLIRNSFGFMLEGRCKSSVRIFADVAWVYEGYLHSNKYQAAFEGTSLYGPYRQARPTPNYARIQAGFNGTKRSLDWKLAYMLLSGKKFIEQSASLKVRYKF
jgi:hypothetical protein